jgi:hypothetical protein
MSMRSHTRRGADHHFLQEAHVLNNLDETASLSIEVIESVQPGHAGADDDIVVCVVRCIKGTARPGMLFRHIGVTGNAEAVAVELELSSVEWYGRKVDQLDTVHSGRVTLTGAGAGTLSRRDTLTAVSHG